jgi:hypothetical protein
VRSSLANWLASATSLDDSARTLGRKIEQLTRQIELRKLRVTRRNAIVIVAGQPVGKRWGMVVSRKFQRQEKKPPNCPPKRTLIASRNSKTGSPTAPRRRVA